MNIENLKQARKLSGMTQKEVADKIGVGQSTYKNYECGFREPNGDTIVQLANLFGVTTDYLLGREEPTKPPDPLAQLNLSPQEHAIVSAYIALPPKERTEFVEIIRKIVAGASVELVIKESETIETPKGNSTITNNSIQ